MFGYHKAKREKKRAKREKQALQSEITRLKKEKETDPVQEQKTHQTCSRGMAASLTGSIQLLHRPPWFISI